MMRDIFLNVRKSARVVGARVVRYLITNLAHYTVWRFNPSIVGITGSVGKTSTKRMIYEVLRSERRVRVSAGNLNNEFGLPLTILGEWSEKELSLISRDHPEGKDTFSVILFWKKVIWLGLWHLLVLKKEEYPQVLVLEYAADRPGDIKKLLNIARPTISVITAVGDVPVHVEYYAGAPEVLREKARLIEFLPVSGYAVLNFDEPAIAALRDRTRAQVVGYGFEKGAHVQIFGFENKIKNGKPAGISFKLGYGGTLVPVHSDHAYGRAAAQSFAAAACLGILFGLNLVKISENLKNYTPAPGRMRILPGIKDIVVLDDAYNASPLSVASALDVLKGMPGTRHIGVLGDMLELGKYTIEAHEKIGARVALCASHLITVGSAAKIIAEAAQANGLDKKCITSFDEVDAASEFLVDFVKKGDTVLVKASHSMGFEQIVRILALPSVAPAELSPEPAAVAE